MTNKEVQDKIKTAKNREWLEQVAVEFKYYDLKKSIEQIGFFNIYQYVRRQCRDWSKIDSNLPNHFVQSKEEFLQLKNQLEIVIKETANKDENILSRQWNAVSSILTSFGQNRRFPIDDSNTIFLIETYKISPDHYNGAYAYLFNPSSINVRTPGAFTGAIMAYEFQHQDSTKIPKRRNAEKSILSRNKNDLEKVVAESTQKVNKFLQDSKATAVSQTKDTLKLIEEKKKEYNDWVNQCKKNDQLYTKQSLERAKELEKLYSANLQVSMPAKYWEERAKEMKIEGDKWRNWFIGFIIAGVIVLIVVIAIISNKAIEDLFSTFGNAIRFSIIFLSLISLMVYGVRSFAKLMFSSYHLRRDAQERKQLAYFYLALIEYKGIEDKDRHLIIQSLFSRADSGLLRDDSGPVMPTSGVMDKIIGGKG